MPKVIITPEALVRAEGPHIELLNEAGFDVFEQEPPVKDSPLFQMNNVVLTPHAAGSDSLAMRDMAIESASYVIDLHRGEWPTNAIINQELKGRWRW